VNDQELEAGSFSVGDWLRGAFFLADVDTVDVNIGDTVSSVSNHSAAAGAVDAYGPGPEADLTAARFSRTV